MYIQAFFSENATDYVIDASDSVGSVSLAGGTNAITLNNSTSMLAAMNLSSSTGVLSVALAYRDNAMLSSVRVGKIIRIEPTVEAQTVYPHQNVTVVLESTAFVSTTGDFSDWRIMFSDDDGRCDNMIGQVVDYATPGELHVSVDLENCTSSTPVISATVSLEWWPASFSTVGPTNVAKILHVSETRASQGIPSTASNIALNIQG